MYKEVLELVYDGTEEIDVLLKKHHKLCNADILFIPYKLTNDKLLNPATLLNSQRFIRLNMCKTPVLPNQINNWFERLYQTDIDRHIGEADKFFDVLEVCDDLDLYSNQFGTSASVEMTDDMLWTEGYGYAKYGQPRIFPAGEIALSHADFRSVEMPSLSINGTVALKGVPIVHRVVGPESISDAQQAEVFRALSVINKDKIILKLSDGKIVDMSGDYSTVGIGLDMLETLIETDQRYRIITEVGFGLEKGFCLNAESNTVLNEPYAENNIGVHIGIGAHHTQLHIDFVMVNMAVRARINDYIVDMS